MYQPGLFQLTQMLRYGCFRYWKHLVYITKETFIPLGEKMQDCNARWMPHSFSKPRKSLLFRCYL